MRAIQHQIHGCSTDSGQSKTPSADPCETGVSISGLVAGSITLTANQEAAFLQLRTGGSLVAADQRGEDNPIYETDVRCDACIMRSASDSDETLEDAQHALLHCCKRPHADRRTMWDNQMAQAMCAAQVVGRDGLGRRGGTMRWRDLQDTDKARLTLGVAPPSRWESLRVENPRTLQQLHEEFICITALYLPDLSKGLRNYHLKVWQSLEGLRPHVSCSAEPVG